jgi:hypothetical protein
MSEFSKLVGKTIVAIEGAKVRSERIAFICSDLSRFSLSHCRECCESVLVEELIGDPQDLIGHVVALADESTNRDNPPEDTDSFLWTFYRIRTHGGDLTIRWLGESSGYYSEDVNCAVDTVPMESLTPEQQVLRDIVLERGA